MLIPVLDEKPLKYPFGKHLSLYISLNRRTPCGWMDYRKENCLLHFTQHFLSSTPPLSSLARHLMSLSSVIGLSLSLPLSLNLFGSPTSTIILGSKYPSIAPKTFGLFLRGPGPFGLLTHLDATSLHGLL